MSVPSLDDTLFGMLEHERAAAVRAGLLASELGGLLPGEKVVDLFCGGGGWTASPRLAALGVRVDYAVNHSPVAIEFHRRNNPLCVHFQGDAWKARPREVTGDDQIGLLLASAACTSHSNARGSAPISPRVHMLGWCIYGWLVQKRPRVVEVENVPEWVHWGPTVPMLDARGRVMRDEKSGRQLRTACRRRRGQHFRGWIKRCRGLGYTVEWRVLDAADFGNPSRRKRLFVKMRRDGLPIVWPEVTHGSRRNVDNGQGISGPRSHRRGRKEDRASHHQGRTKQEAGSQEWADQGDASVIRADQGLTPHRCAADIIDWSDLGTSIFEGRKNKKSWGGTRVAKKTFGRIAEGIGRHVIAPGEAPAPGEEHGSESRATQGPFTLRVTHGEGRGWKVASIDSPLPTLTTRQDMAVVSPVLAPQNTGVYGQGVDQVGPTITTTGHQSLIAPVLAGAGGSAYAAKPKRVDVPLNTVKCDPRIGLAAPVLATTRNGERGGPNPQRPRCNAVTETLNTVVANSSGQGVAVPVMQAIRGNASARSPQEPLPTITAGNGPGRGAGAAHALGMLTPLLTPAGGPECNATPAGEPLGTVLTREHRAVASPVLVQNNTHHTGGPVDAPVPTITTGGQSALATPVMLVNRGGPGSSQHGTDPGAPLATVCTSEGHHGLAVPLMTEYYSCSKSSRTPDESLGCVVTRDRHGLASPVVTELDVLACPKARARAVKLGKLLKRCLGDRVRLNAEGMALAVVGGVEYVIVDVLFRMLRVRELAAAMGFPPEYAFPKTQREAVKLIGNAVSVHQAEALILSSLPRGGSPERRRRTEAA